MYSSLRKTLHFYLPTTLGLHPDGADFEIKRRGQLVYINIFCFDLRQQDGLLAIVQSLYEKHGRGLVKKPSVSKWIQVVL